MTNVAAKPKPKVICGLQGCTKDYTKNYMKVHQKNVHKVNNIEEAMNATIDNTSDDALSGRTQNMLNAIQEEEINEALEAEESVFDKVGYILEGDRYFVSMVSHMVTPKLMEKQIVIGIFEILIDTVEKVANENREESDKAKSDCTECSKYKQVKEHKEAHITKIEKEKKHLNEKLRSMTGQKRYYFNKCNDLEAQLKEANHRNK